MGIIESFMKLFIRMKLSSFIPSVIEAKFTKGNNSVSLTTVDTQMRFYMYAKLAKIDVEVITK